jgi:glycosyltransferase involved in cell wall biosynthesis
LRFADATIATSRREAGRLTRRLATSEVHYIPNGIQAPVVARASERAEPPRHLAYVGRLAPEKRADLFLRVAAELASIYPDLRVSVMGAGPLAKPLRSLAQRLGIDERCEFTGLVDDVEQRLQHVDVLLSLSDTEGTPRAILEAMSMGVTVVATEVGGVPELIISGRTGLLVPTGPATVPAAVAALRSLLADPGRLRAIGGAASEAVRSEFLIEGMAERTLAIYDSILSSNPSEQRSA